MGNFIDHLDLAAHQVRNILFHLGEAELLEQDVGPVMDDVVKTAISAINGYSFDDVDDLKSTVRHLSYELEVLQGNLNNQSFITADVVKKIVARIEQEVL